MAPRAEARAGAELALSAATPVGALRGAGPIIGGDHGRGYPPVADIAPPHGRLMRYFWNPTRTIWCRQKSDCLCKLHQARRPLETSLQIRPVEETTTCPVKKLSEPPILDLGSIPFCLLSGAKRIEVDEFSKSCQVSRIRLHDVLNHALKGQIRGRVQMSDRSYPFAHNRCQGGSGSTDRDCPIQLLPGEMVG